MAEWDGWSARSANHGGDRRIGILAPIRRVLALSGAVCLWFTAPVSGQTRGSEKGKTELKVEVSLAGHEPQGYALNVKLVNAGRESLAVYEPHLPWTYGMLLVTVGLFDGDRVEERRVLQHRFYTPDGKALREVVIEPGASLEGSIRLASVFPDFQKTLETKEILLFWSYQVKPVRGNVSERYGGWMMLPRSGPTAR